MINLPGQLPAKHPDSAVLNGILGSISKQGMGVSMTNIIPTATSVQPGQAVIYDNGAGTKRVYVVTHLGNLGYITLT